MADLGTTAGGVLDQLNPFGLGNLILYFAWLIIFTFTGIAVWRCGVPWLRLVCYLINQVVSVGVLLSWTLTGLLAYTYWWESVGVFAGTAAGAFYLFRPRKRRAI